MKGIIYVRVSSDEQVLGTSLAFQEEICMKYCAEHHIDVLAVFREEGASAKTANRPELVRALEFCRKSKLAVQAFVVAKVDRFARNTEDHFTVRGMLKRYGASLHSVTEPIGNSPTEKLLETVLAGSAEFDNAIRTQRSTDGMKTQLRRGIWPWQVPVGYLSAGTKKQGLKKLAPDPADPLRFPIIQRGLQAYAAGSIQSLSQLAQALNTWGLSSAKGRPMSVQMVDRLLGKHLAFYTGRLTDPFTGAEVPGGHEAMISDEEYRRIRLIRSGRLRNMKPRDYDTMEYPLRRTVLCSACLRPHTASAPRGRTKRYAYYHCASKECRLYGRSFPQACVERLFAAKLSRVRPRFQTLLTVLRSIIECSKRQRLNEHLKRRALDLREQALQAQRARIFEMREDGSYTREQFTERQRSVDDQLDAVAVELDDLKEYSVDIGPLIHDGLSFIRDLMSSWQALPPRLKRRFQRIIFPVGITYDTRAGFGTAQLGRIFELFGDSRMPTSRLVPLDGAGWNQIVSELQELRAIYDEWKSLTVPENAGAVPQIPTSLDPPDDSPLAA